METFCSRTRFIHLNQTLKSKFFDTLERKKGLQSMAELPIG